MGSLSLAMELTRLMKLFQLLVTFLALIAITCSAAKEENTLGLEKKAYCPTCIKDLSNGYQELDDKVKRYYREFRPLSFLPYTTDHYHPELPLAMMLKPPSYPKVSIKPDGMKTTNSYQLGKTLSWYWPVLTKMTKNLKEGLHRIENENKARRQGFFHPGMFVHKALSEKYLPLQEENLKSAGT